MIAHSDRAALAPPQVRKDTFWLLYLLLVLITFVGLVVTAQLRPLAEAFDIPIKTFVYALQERAQTLRAHAAPF